MLIAIELNLRQCGVPASIPQGETFRASLSADRSARGGFSRQALWAACPWPGLDRQAGIAAVGGRRVSKLRRASQATAMISSSDPELPKLIARFSKRPEAA